MTLPNFLGLGVQKAATSWLHEQLRAHPAIYLPSARKEIHYFDAYYDRGEGWYAGFFPDDHQARQFNAIGEITPKYFLDENVPARIAATLGQPSFLLVLRNPVTRFYSQYRMSFSTGATNSDPETYLHTNRTAFTRGLYAMQLKRYLEFFPIDRFLVLVYEELFENEQSTRTGLDRVANHLGVDPAGFEASPARRSIGSDASSGRPRFSNTYRHVRRFRRWLRHKDLDAVVRLAKKTGISKRSFGGTVSEPPPLDAAFAARLAQEYSEDIAELESLLGRTLWDHDGTTGERRPR